MPAEATPVETTRRRTAQPTVAEYLTQQIALCGKTQSEIARECGFAKPNIITMFKQGLTKLPVSKIGVMARALGVDPLHLYKLVMSEYEPDTWAALQNLVLKQPVVSQNEARILDVIRQTNPNDPGISSEYEQSRLVDWVKSLKATKDLG